MEKRLKRDELIGKEIKIISSKNKTCEGLSGKIINETKNTIEMKTSESKRKTLIKKNIVIEMKTSGCIIKGSEIIASPEERVKIR